MSQIDRIVNASISRRNFLGLFGASALTVALAGCGSSNPSSATTDAATTGDVTKVIVGTEGTYAPYSYLDDSNNLTGFDVEVARAIGEKLDGYELDFQTIEWSSMFASLDAGKIQTISNQVAANDERKQKYLFTDTPYSYSVSAVAYKKGRTDLKTIDDLQGKTVDGGTTTNYTTWVENYNAEHGNTITINYTDGDISKMLQDVVNGRVDATVNSPVTIKKVADEQGIDIDWFIVPEAGVVPIYFPFANTDEGSKLRDAFETAIQELIADGTISGLSEKFLGADYSTEDAVNKLADEQSQN